MKKYYLECECDSPEHLLRFWFDEDEKDYLYIYVQLNHYMNFWNRLKTSVWFLFKSKTGYWIHYDNTMISKERIKELKNIIKEFEKK